MVKQENRKMWGQRPNRSNIKSCISCFASGAHGVMMWTSRHISHCSGLAGSNAHGLFPGLALLTAHGFPWQLFQVSGISSLAWSPQHLHLSPQFHTRGDSWGWPRHNPRPQPPRIFFGICVVASVILQPFHSLWLQNQRRMNNRRSATVSVDHDCGWWAWWKEFWESLLKDYINSIDTANGWGLTNSWDGLEVLFPTGQIQGLGFFCCFCYCCCCWFLFSEAGSHCTDTTGLGLPL